jgi:hypothetical protein
MPFAEFEEKQYEMPANIELGLQHAAVFAAGQVLEAVVGYDVAAHPPQNAPIWRLVGVNAPPGLQLVPNLWQRARVRPRSAALPSTYVSLIFQYKRPQYLSTSLALQWHHWGGSYYRFPIVRHQQDTLEALENALGARAAVRYACAAFWTYGNLQTHQASQSVLANSTFVPPASLVGHQVWTYNAPGTAGFANPRHEEIPTERFRDVWGKIKGQRRTRRENLFEHLRGLGAGIGVPMITENTGPGWLAEFASQNHLEAVQRQSVLDAIGVADHCGKAGASWFVADMEIANP